MLKAGFIINTRVSSRQKIEELFFPFENDDIKFYYFPTEYAGHSIELAARLKREKFDWIISVGGDGTLNEIVNGLIHEDESDRDLPSLGMFPAGTGNDYSLSIKTSRKPEDLIRAMLSNSSQAIDIGKISNEKGSIRYFINVADAGMGGEVTQKIATSGNVMGKWVYYKTILLSLLTYKRPRLHIAAKGIDITTKVISVVMGKGISFGGGYKIVPDAKLDDGKFFVAVIGDISIFTYLIKIPHLMKGKKIDHPLVHYFSAESLKIENVSDLPCYLEMDGEASFSCPVEVICLKAKIRFMHLHQ